MAQDAHGPPLEPPVGPPSAPSASRGALLSWAFYDWANQAFATVVLTFVFAAYFVREVAPDEATGAAWWGYAVGGAGACVALVDPVLGAVADRGGRRKPWIAAFTALCVLTTGALWWVEPEAADVGLALLLVALGTIGAELAMVFYNAMLPDLVSEERLGRWSGWAWGLGYLGGLLCLAAALLLFVRGDAWISLDRERAEDVRAVFPMAALWYLLFALPLLLFTPEAPRAGGRAPLRLAAREGLAQLRDTARQIRSYGGIVRFLIARLVYTDGLATLFAMGGAYAAGAFDMTAVEVLAFGLAMNVTAGLGAVAFAWLDDRLGARTIIRLALVGLLLPGVGILLVTTPRLFWTFGLLLGLFVGPVQAASRSYLARASPPELRGQLFGLFALSGKATAFMGPLLVGWITHLSGSQRVGMSVILAQFAIGLALMVWVPRAADARPRPPGGLPGSAPPRSGTPGAPA